jgi:hypothetical protein
MRKKISYVIQSSVGIGAWAVLILIVSIRVASADQLGLAVKLAMCGFLWGSMAYGAHILIRYYKKMNDYDGDSDDQRSN